MIRRTSAALAVAPNPSPIEVPALLKSLPNWVQWKLAPNDDGVLGKIPFIAGTDFTRKAASTRAATWTTFDEATKNIELTATQGIGFVVHGDAVAAGIVGIDIDGCRNPATGDIMPWAEQLIEALDSYTEVTPSQTGVRVWVRGKLPKGDRKFSLDLAAGFGDKVQIEVYDRSRYFTVTGDHYYNESVDIETRDLAEAYKLCRELADKYPTKKETPAATEAPASQDVAPVAEGAKIERTGSTITSKLELLMHGEPNDSKPFVIDDGQGNTLTYPSHSEADLALCTELALKHGNNPDLIWSDYADSSLAREKWLKREGDFRSHTIAHAILTAERMKAESTKTVVAAEAAPDLTQSITNDQLADALGYVGDMGIFNRSSAFEELMAKNHPLVAHVKKESEVFVSVDVDQFLDEDIPPRKVLIRTINKKEAVFYEQSINQIFAWRGTGKTNLGLGLTKAFATGGSFLNWEATQKSRVLYIEGELPQSQFQERLRQIVGKTGGYARLVTIDKQPGHIMPKLSTQAGMDKVEATLAALEAEGFKTEVLMLDSISTLFNVSANEEEAWLGIQDWLISLRSRGLTIFYYHHSGKGGASRSHSKNEDMLDVSLKLEAPKEKEPGCLHAIMTYDKARAGLDEPSAEIKMRRTHSDTCACRKTQGMLIGCRGDGVEWHYQPAEDAKMSEAFAMFAEEATLGEVAKAMGITRSQAQRWRKKWEERRDADPDAAL